jgi:hypothetical protein
LYRNVVSSIATTIIVSFHSAIMPIMVSIVRAWLSSYAHMFYLYSFIIFFVSFIMDYNRIIPSWKSWVILDIQFCHFFIREFLTFFIFFVLLFMLNFIKTKKLIL